MPDERRPACLLIHGAGGGAWEWDLWCATLAAHGIDARVVELAASARGLAATSLDDYHAQVQAALRGVPRPRVAIGASLGGLLAVRVADQVDALVLINPLPPAPWHAQLPAREWPDVVPWGRRARLASTRRALPDADPATALAALRGWRDESGAVLRDAHRGLAVAPPVVPVLCVVSQRDDDVPPSTTRALGAAWGADLVDSAASSHVGPLLGIHAARDAQAACAWLARIFSSPAR